MPKPTMPENATPIEMTPAQQAREDAMLELLTEQQATIDSLKADVAAMSARPATAPSKAESLRQEFDREAEALLDEFKDYPAISMITRRVVDGVAASYDIRLKRDADIADESKRYWTLHWFNLGKENRAQEMADRGWDKTRWDELHNSEAVASGVHQDEFVRRGDRGVEVLGKMPRKLFDHLKRRESAVANGLLSSESGLRSALANTTAMAVGKSGGNADQAGTMIQSGQFIVEVTEGPKEHFRA